MINNTNTYLKLNQYYFSGCKGIFNSQRNFNCLFFAGIFFVLPCIESYQKVDLRTITLGVPPQEVHIIDLFKRMET